MTGLLDALVPFPLPLPIPEATSGSVRGAFVDFSTSFGKMTLRAAATSVHRGLAP